MASNNAEYLQPTEILDFNHSRVTSFVDRHIKGVTDQIDQAIRLYFAVRDGIRYDPYAIELTVEALRASTTLAKGKGWCVPKGALLAACCRLVGIPAKLGYADVRNHLSTERMRAQMKTDIFEWHGYTAIHLNGKWVKATPAFNIELCERFNLRPLDFDGTCDSIYHPFDLLGNKHMEYLRYRGEYADIPIAEMAKDFPRHFLKNPELENYDFDDDVNLEQH